MGEGNGTIMDDVISDSVREVAKFSEGNINPCTPEAHKAMVAAMKLLGNVAIDNRKVIRAITTKQEEISEKISVLIVKVQALTDRMDPPTQDASHPHTPAEVRRTLDYVVVWARAVGWPVATLVYLVGVGLGWWGLLGPVVQ